MLIYICIFGLLVKRFFFLSIINTEKNDVKCIFAHAIYAAHVLKVEIIYCHFTIYYVYKYQFMVKKIVIESDSNNVLAQTG